MRFVPIEEASQEEDQGLQFVPLEEPYEGPPIEDPIERRARAGVVDQRTAISAEESSAPERAGMAIRRAGMAPAAAAGRLVEGFGRQAEAGRQFLKSIPNTLEMKSAVDRLSRKADEIRQIESGGSVVAFSPEAAKKRTADLRAQILQDEQTVNDLLAVYHQYKRERDKAGEGATSFDEVLSGKGDFWTWAGESLGQGVVSMAPILAAAAVPVVGGPLGLGAGVALNTADIQQQRQDQRIDERYFGSAGVARPSAIEQGMLEGQQVIEQIDRERDVTGAVVAGYTLLDVALGPAGKAIKGGFVRLFGKEGAEAAEKEVAEQLAKLTKAQVVKAVLKEMGFQTFEEALNEGGQEFLSVLMEKALDDKDVFTYDTAKRLMNAAAAGGLTGGVVGGAAKGGQIGVAKAKAAKSGEPGTTPADFKALEDAPDGGKVTPSGRVISKEEWDNASPRVRAAWMQTAGEPGAEAVAGVEVTEGQVEEITAAPAPVEEPERVTALRQELAKVKSADARKIIEEEIASELKVAADTQKADDLVAAAADVSDPAVKKRLLEQAEKIRPKPAKGGVKVEELGTIDEAFASKEEKPSTKGMKVEEGESVEAKPVDEQAAIDEAARRDAEERELPAPKKSEAKKAARVPDVATLSGSELLRRLKREGGLPIELASDLGLDPKELSRFSLFRREQPSESGRLFTKNGRLREDNLIMIAQDMGLMTEAEAQSDNAQEMAFEIVRNELRNPGSAKPVAQREADMIAKAERKERDAMLDQMREDAEAFGIDLTGLTDKQIAERMRDAYAGLDAKDVQDLDSTMIARMAADIDPDAVERAAIASEGDLEAFLREAQRIIDGHETSQARPSESLALGGKGTQPAPGGRSQGGAPAQAQPAAQQAAEGRRAPVRDQQGAGPAERGADTGRRPTAEQPGAERGGAPGRVDDTLSLGGSRDQTKTPEFKRWFGNSKVVDADGKPLVVYHGTPTPGFKKFKRQTGGWSGGLGIWFGSDPEIANQFAKPRFADQGPAVFPVYLSVRNPMVYEGWSAFTAAVTARGKGDIGANQKSLRNSLIRAGYDGIVIRGSDTDMGGTRDDWVAFLPEQIKSAIGNRGAFDPANPDITLSLGGAATYTGRDEVRQVDRNRPIDGATLRTLRREAAGIERPDIGAYLRVTDDGRAIATGPAGEQIPAAFRDFARKHKLPLTINRNGLQQQDIPTGYRLGDSDAGRGRMGSKAGQPVTGAPMASVPATQSQAPMPIEYREGGALYAAEMGDQTYSPSDRETQFSVGAPNAIGLYSALERALDQQIKAKSMPKGDWLNTLKSLPAKGVKPDEIEWSGIREWLELQGPRVEKQAVLDYLNANGVKVEETVLPQPVVQITELPDHYTVEQEEVEVGEKDRKLRLRERYDEIIDDLSREYDQLSAAKKEELEVLDMQFQNYTHMVEYQSSRRRMGGRSNRVVDTGRLLHPDVSADPSPFIEWANSVKPGAFNADVLVAGKQKRWVVRGELPRERPTILRGKRIQIAVGRTANEARKNAIERLNRDAFSNRQREKFSTYVVPGGTNYREVLLTLPDRPSTGKEGPAGWASTDSSRGRAGDANFRSSHWDQPNVLAHVRVDDRVDADGKRVLFVNEIQSDWAQKGRKEGFANPESADFNIEVRLVGSWHPQFPETRDKWRVTVDGQDRGYIQAEDENEARYKASVNERNRRENTSKVPRAPFIDTTDKWVTLALKRILRMAAEGGYDKVAFINGQQAADLYDLSKRVSAISYAPQSNRLTAWAVGDMPGSEPIIEKVVARDDLPDVVGKEIADRLLNRPTKVFSNGVHHLSGLDLKVGGEGMRAFYDKIVPAAANKLLAKVGGGKVEATVIGQPRESRSDYSIKERAIGGYVARIGSEAANFSSWEDANAWLNERFGSEQPAITITPEMRKKVMSGMPMFKVGEQSTGETKAAPKRVPPPVANTLQEVADALAERFKEPVVWTAVDPFDKALGDKQVLQNRLAAKFVEQIFDKMTYWYEQASGPVINGFSSTRMPRAIFMSVNGKHPTLAVTGHEFLHMLRKTAPEVYNDFADAMWPIVKAKFPDWKAEIQDRYKRTGSDEAIGDDLAYEELMADTFGDRWTEPEFWQELADQTGGRWQRLADRFMAFLDDLIGKVLDVRPFGTDKYISDLKRARQVVAKAMIDYKRVVNRDREAQGIQAGLDQRIANMSVADTEVRSREEDRVSPRAPSGVKATEDPYTGQLQPDLATMARDPEILAHNVNLLRDSVDMPKLRGTPREKAEQAIEHMKVNLLWLYNHMQQDLRDRAKQWYVGGNRIAHRFAKQYGVSPAQAAAVIAAFSPQKHWFENVRLAEGFLRAVTQNSGDRMDAAAMQKIRDRDWWQALPVKARTAIAGKTLREVYGDGSAENLLSMAHWIRAWDEANLPQESPVISPEGDFNGVYSSGLTGKPVKLRAQGFNAMTKGLKILIDGSPRNISDVIGMDHKVRSFYNNIIAPESRSGDVTIDTHAVAAAHLLPLGSSAPQVMQAFGGGIADSGKASKSSIISGLSGNYALYAEAYRRAAAEVGVLPREMQSIAWEAIRGLFRPEQKRSLGDSIANIWRQAREGEISEDAAREQISQLAGGVARPDWAGPAGGRAEEARPAADAGELPRLSVPGGRAEPAAGGTRGAAAEGTAPSVTDTPEFRRWFGNSKVVDENGAPLVVYHGTDAEDNFDVFDTMDFGAWFAERPRVAETYVNKGHGGGSRLIPAYLRIERPLVIPEGVDMSDDLRVQDALRAINKENGTKFTAKQIQFDGNYEGGAYEFLAMNNWFIEAAQKAGFDGLFAFEAGEPTWNAFSEKQIKSAIGNRGTFDPANPDITLSLVGPPSQALRRSPSNPQGGFWNTPDPLWRRMLDYLNRGFADNLERLARVQKALGPAIRDEINTYAKETGMHGRQTERLVDIKRRFMDPIHRITAVAKLSQQDVSDYLYALHAPEANAHIAQINPNLPTGGSGLTDAEARSIIAGFKPEQRKALDKIAALVRSMNDEKLERMVVEGLITRDYKNELQAKFPNWVSLKNFEDDSILGASKVAGMSGGMEIKGKEFKARTGRVSRAEDPLTMTVRDAMLAVIRAEKNRVARSFIQMVRENPNPDLWEMVTEANYPTRKEVGADGTVREVKDAGALFREPQFFGAKVDGEQVFVRIKDELLAEQMHKLGESGFGKGVIGDIGRAINTATRTMSMLYTQLSPDFMLVNPIRDVQQSIVVATSFDKAKGNRLALRLAKSLPAALATSMRYQWAKLIDGTATGPDAALFEQFRMDGGTTGGFGLMDAEQIQRELQRQIDAASGKPTAMAIKAATTLFEPVMALNDAFENMSRFAVYKAALEEGFTRQQATVMAKNVTVNFNKRGTASPVFNALYAFFNASIQGNLVVARAIAKSRTAQAAALGLFMLGIMQEIAGDEEDETGTDPKDYVSEFKRDRAFVMPIGEGKAITVPLAYGLNIPFAMGRHAVRAITGKESPGHAVAKLLELTFTTYLPTQTWTPTPIQPLVAAAQNRDFADRQIAKENPFDDITPKSEQYRENANKAAIGVAKALNSMTGGSEFEKGAVDIAPEKISYVVKQYMGGIAAPIEIMSVPFKETVKARDIPVYRRFVNERSDSFYVGQARGIENENRLQRRIIENTDAEVGDAKLDYLEESREAERDLARLYRDRNQAKKAGNKEEVKAIDAEIDRAAREIVTLRNRAKSAEVID